MLDTDDDGSISLAELRTGLATQLKSAITEDQAAKILQRFDLDGDGSIQINEFKGIDAFRLILDKIMLEEKNAVIDATQKLVIAKKTAESAAAKANAIQEQVNNLPPTTSDKIVSLLPYLLPLADAIPYSKEFIIGNNLQNDNFVFEFAYSIFVIYQTIPFSGLIAFFLLDLLTNNLKLNRLIRFNMQQAIFFDIALIFPGVLGSVVSLIVSQTDFVIPSSLGTVGSTATFLLVSLGIIYSLASSLLGILPDKVPIISDRAKLRVPTAEQIIAGIEEEKDDWTLPGEGFKNIRKSRQSNRREVEQVEDSAATEDGEDKKSV
jgi:Chloroplast import apparatus Tic20-like/EF-hand domain pair